MNPVAKVKEAFRSIDGQLQSLRASEKQLASRLDEMAERQKLLDEQAGNLTRELAQANERCEQAQRRAEQAEQELAHQKQLAWHMQYFYDSMWARAEWERTEALCPGNRARVEALRNCHKGERCFIIGNGPSLRAEDLDKLKNEVTFACNRINLIFNQTDWRPTYYCVTDLLLFGDSLPELCRTDFASSHCLFCSQSLDQVNCISEANYFVRNGMYREIPEFSADAFQWLYEGGTVTYISIQMAAYMGFSEIYLLGVDNNYHTKTLPNGKVVFDWKGSHFSENYVEDSVSKKMESWINLADRMNLGIYDLNTTYQAALWHSRELGISIYNATRGGALEVFPRVDFDQIMKKEK